MSAPSVRCGISVVGDTDAAIVCMEKLRRSRLQTELDAHLAAIKKSYGWRVVDIERELRGTGVQRTGICDGRKSAEFPAGGMRWGRRPLRIGVRDETSATRALRKMGMENFLCTCTDVSLGAILREPDAAPDLKGVEVRRVGEEFVVCLFGARL